MNPSARPPEAGPVSSGGARRSALPAGRWHFQHGPIDIVIGADGDAAAVAAAHAAAWQRFETVLAELVAELPLLRQPLRPPARRPVHGRADPVSPDFASLARSDPDPCSLQGAVARRMWHACEPYRTVFITPMAAVAGAVAEELIGCYQRRGIARAWVNNGGDIALHLAPGASVKVGLYADLARFDAQALADSTTGRLRTDADFEVRAALPVRGIATSGWRGRSFSLGIADSVTVLAASASAADAAATIVANAVDIDDPRIRRRPANELKDDTDLGSLPVTVDVPQLEAPLLRRALQAGERRARELQRAGLIYSVVLVCQHAHAVVQPTGDVGSESPRGLSSEAPGASPNESPCESLERHEPRKSHESHVSLHEPLHKSLS